MGRFCIIGLQHNQVCGLVAYLGWVEILFHEAWVIEPGDEEFLGEFGRYGTGDGEFIWPSGIAKDKHGNLFVTDEWLNRVSIFDPDGKFMSAWSTLVDGDEGPNGASDIAISDDQTVYITDSRSHEVKVF